MNPNDPEIQQDREERLRWFKEAKFGMFIHWGLYSHLAGEWQGRQVPVGEIAEWIMHDMQIPASEYRQIARQFNPVRFDAQEWVRLAKAAGMKYLVVTAKHHEGFAMYHSKVSDYNIVDASPFGRDPMVELAEACRQEGIRFCFYYSHREDWDDPDAYGNDWDFDPAQKDFERYLEEKSKPQLRELLTGYGPLGLIWFDRGIHTREQAQAFVDIIHELQPQCLINGRVGHYEQELEGDFQDLNDNGMPIGGIEEYWETPQTLNDTWGYSKFDDHWKSSQNVIHRLVEIVSQGGNYLLNVGPTGEGVIPQPSVEILTRVGEWVQRNGESIYGTTASPFPALPWGRCTVKGEKLYLHVFDWPTDGRLEIPGLKNRVQAAHLLADKEHRLPVTRQGDTVAIDLPAGSIDDADTVVVLEIVGSPQVDPPVVQQDADGTVLLDYVHAITAGKAVKRFNRKGRFHISKWTGPQDTISWYLDVARPGVLQVQITYAARGEQQGRAYVVSVADQQLRAQVEDTGDWYDYQTFSIGTVELPEAGRYTLTVRPADPSEADLMYFKAVQLS